MRWDVLGWVWIGLGWDGWDRFVEYGFGWIRTGWDVIRFYGNAEGFNLPAISF
jgi:hypothetical protein